MTQLKIRSIKNISIIELMNWCREYHNFTEYPVKTDTRFAIAFYQVYQGIEWGNNPNGWESYAAAIIHLLCTAESLDISVYPSIPDSLYNVRGKSNIDCREILIALSKIQQMLVYRDSRTKRKSRYKIEIIHDNIVFCLNSFAFIISIGLYEQCCITIN